MSETLVAVEDVHFSYKGAKDRAILSAVSLQMQPGEMVALLGASGSGKSTLLSLIGLLNLPDKGAISFLERDTASFSEAERCAMRATKLGFVFQHHFLLPELTALENVVLAGKLAEPYRQESYDFQKSAQELLEFLGLTERMHAFPRQLSGGEQQRVSLARALVNKPDLLLADEPTGNLDSASGARVLELMAKLQEKHGTAMLLVTHDKDVASTCGRQLTIKDGSLISE